MKIAATFFVSGLLAGLLFAILINLPVFESYCFEHDPKIGRIPRIPYRLTIGLLASVGLATAYFASVWNRWIERSTLLRELMAFALVSGFNLFTFLFFSLANGPGGLLELFLSFAAVIFGILAIAVCALTGRFILVPFAFLLNVLAFSVAVGVIYVTFPLVRRLELVCIDIVEYGAEFSLLSLAFGLWLAWRSRRRNADSR